MTLSIKSKAYFSTPLTLPMRLVGDLKTVAQATSTLPANYVEWLPNGPASKATLKTEGGM